MSVILVFVYDGCRFHAHELTTPEPVGHIGYLTYVFFKISDYAII